MKQHMKRLSAPKRWNIARKENTYIARPRPAGTPLSFTLPLSHIIRTSGVANTLKEIKYLLSSSKILVDGKVRKDPKFGVGFFASVSIPEENKHLRLILSPKGMLELIAIPAAETGLKIGKIMNIRRNKAGYSFTLFDGRSIQSAKKIATTGGSLLYTLPAQEIKETLPLEAGCSVMLIAGKHPGILGKIEAVSNDSVTIKTQGQTFTVTKSSVLVVGKGTNALTLA